MSQHEPVNHSANAAGSTCDRLGLPSGDVWTNQPWLSPGLRHGRPVRATALDPAMQEDEWGPFAALEKGGRYARKPHAMLGDVQVLLQSVTQCAHGLSADRTVAAPSPHRQNHPTCPVGSWVVPGGGSDDDVSWA